jgi:uncharacterized membrane protein
MSPAPRRLERVRNGRATDTGPGFADRGRAGTGAEFRAEGRLDKAFEVGILLKGLDGLLEVAGGILLFFIRPEYLNHLAITLTQHELTEDPRDFLATHLLHSTQNLAAGSLVFAALYLLSHGLVKLVLVWEILHNRLWAYLGLIYLTIGFMIYQVYRFTYSHSISLVLLTVFDGVIVYLTVVEYRKRRSRSGTVPA